MTRVKVIPGPARAVKSAQLLAQAKKEIAASNKAELWSLHLQARAVTLLVGQTSAGKTTFLHRLAWSLAEGREFLGIEAPRPLRVLYVDYESPLDVFVEHSEKIGLSENLYFMDPAYLPKGPDLVSELDTMIRRQNFDVVIVDPLLVAYPVEDENNNMEASAQVLAFKDLAKGTGAGIVVVHNSGRRKEEAPDDDAFFGRGASARSDRADVGINFRKAGPSRRYLTVVKSRRSNLGVRIDFEFAGELDYRLTSPSGALSASKSAEALVTEVTRIVAEESTATSALVSRQTVRMKLGIAEDSAEDKQLSKALVTAVSRVLLKKPKYGHYRLPSESEKGDLFATPAGRAISDEVPDEHAA